MLYDNHGRQINYLRLAVTDRCNLRCRYCMPEEGIDYVPKDMLLSYEEMLRIVHVVAQMGIDKVRITGGEPFVRKGMLDFIRELCAVEGIRTVHITTNGTMTRELIPDLVEAGVKSVNLSLDTINRERFFKITRRDLFDPVMETLHKLIASGIRTKINAVVMDGLNTEDIVPLVGLTRDLPVDVRFIEEMPFNGEGAKSEVLVWHHKKILHTIMDAYPLLGKLEDPPFSTSASYRVPGYKGTVGIIAAWTRTFCGTCNRLRLTPQGMLKTCLYDQGVFNIRDFLRAGTTDAQLRDAFLQAIGHRAIDGWEAERKQRLTPVSESMSTIGG